MVNRVPEANDSNPLHRIVRRRLSSAYSRYGAAVSGKISSTVHFEPAARSLLDVEEGLSVLWRPVDLTLVSPVRGRVHTVQFVVADHVNRTALIRVVSLAGRLASARVVRNLRGQFLIE